MGETSGKNESARRPTEEVMREIDGKTESPELRAAKVFSLLKASEYTDWDLICFSISYLGSQVIARNWPQEGIKQLNKCLYANHYLAAKEIGLI